MVHARKTSRLIFCTVMVVVLLAPLIGAQGAGEDSLELVSEGKFQALAGTSKTLARQIALFEAKKKAVESAGRYLAGKHLVLSYEQKKEEIYSLVTTKIDSKIIAENESSSGDGYTYIVRIRTTIRSADYIEADILDKKLQIEETRETLKEELEPEITAEIDPGMDIAKAYRLLRQEKLRPAMIYLNRLEKKYPNWAAIYMVRAIGFYLLHEPSDMKKELNKACAAGNPSACDDLKSIRRVRQFDLHAETVD